MSLKLSRGGTVMGKKMGDRTSPCRRPLSDHMWCFRSESYPEGSCRDGAQPNGGLGSGRVHGLWLSAEGGNPRPPVGTGRGAWDVQVGRSTECYTTIQSRILHAEMSNEEFFMMYVGPLDKTPDTQQVLTDEILGSCDWAAS